MSRLWNSIGGYAKIMIKGLRLENIINDCHNENILFWDIKRPSNMVIYANLKASDFFLLRKIVKRHAARLYLIEKKGAPFYFIALQARKAAIAGAVLFLAGLFVSAFFIWDIKIEGSIKSDDKQIYAILESNGAKIGAFRPKLDLGKIENEVAVQCPYVVWAGARLLGSRLVLEVVEQPSRAPSVDDTVPAHIVASKDAIIQSSTVYAGKAAIAENHSVQKGEILITGIMGTEEAPRLVRARGEVIGRVWYAGEAKMARMADKQVRTGNVEDGNIIDFVLYETLPNTKFTQFESEDINSFRIKNLFLPLKITKQRYYETKTRKVEIDESILKAAVQEAAWRNAIKSIPNDAQIVDMKYNFFTQDDYMICTLSIETIENIGLTQEIKDNLEEVKLDEPTQTETNP